MLGPCHQVFRGVFCAAVSAVFEIQNEQIQMESIGSWCWWEKTGTEAVFLTCQKTILLFLFFINNFLSFFFKRHRDIQRLWEWRESDVLGKRVCHLSEGKTVHCLKWEGYLYRLSLYKIFKYSMYTEVLFEYVLMIPHWFWFDCLYVFQRGRMSFLMKGNIFHSSWFHCCLM